MTLKPTLFILEGADCTGKTTLAREIAKYTGAMQFHCTASPLLFQGLADYHLNVLENVKTNMENGLSVVLDRFWPSEYVYGQLFRPGSEYLANHVVNIAKETMGINVVYVMCFSNNAWNRYKVGHIDPAHSLSREQFLAIYTSYLQLFKTMQGDYSNHSNVAVTSYIIEQDSTDEVTLNKYLQSLVYGIQSRKIGNPSVA